MSFLFCLNTAVLSQTVTLDTSEKGLHQTIDGFGTCGHKTDDWYRTLYFDDLRCSIVRVDMTPKFKSPWSDHSYNSPWFHNDPAQPGPDGNNVRTYTGAADYTREFAGRRAAIAVMGPDIDDNIRRYYDLDNERIKGGGTLARIGADRRKEIGEVKLLGCVWSPAPWLKVPSGNRITGQSDPMPKNGAPWPFLWYDNFAGGLLDVSGEPRKEFDDSAMPGGKGPTSALTQYARGFAAWVRGYQNKFGVKFYALSLQNEPHLEVFYNSCLYRTADQYIAALKAARAEFDKYPDLKDIKLTGPEDTVGSDSTYLWFWESNGFKQHKLLQIMKAIESDPVAAKALDFYCVHGYAADGITSAGGEPAVWDWSARGWKEAPNPQVPPNVKGYESYGKKCWETETSGDRTEWLYPAVGFPSQGAFSIALKIHQALAVGNTSAWLYWQLSDEKADYRESLTNPEVREKSAKMAAARHYFRYIRPGAIRIEAAVTETKKLKASVFLHEKDGKLVWVLINASKQEMKPQLIIPSGYRVTAPAETFTSSDEALWKSSTVAFTNGVSSVTIPGFGVMTVVANIKK
ncbi:MAG TPA: hypothetical protein DET40_01030 [Lentisphaeria bacterium]|nr:MAG: hypothetical protein A2X45_25115 [Lentisphaerae bacterium GWF2_50_93]HCE42115.1 hypothetical protein [Lentisphaeria bacterium]